MQYLKETTVEGHMQTHIYQMQCSISPPYTFFLLNGDIELHRNR